MVERALECLKIAVDEKPRGKAGVPNQAITKPITINSDTAEVMVKTSTGKQRVRKGQSEQQYEEQLSHFYNVEKGPVLQPIGWMNLPEFEKSVESFDLELKHNRLVLIGYVHKFYYMKQYQDCLKCCETLKERYDKLKCIKKMKKEFEELQYTIDKCQERI